MVSPFQEEIVVSAAVSLQGAELQLPDSVQLANEVFLVFFAARLLSVTAELNCQFLTLDSCQKLLPGVYSECQPAVEVGFSTICASW